MLMWISHKNQCACHYAIPMAMGYKSEEQPFFFLND